MSRRAVNCRLGRVTWSNPKRKAKKSKSRKPTRVAAKRALSCSKKIGRWRVTCAGRKITAAGASHSYKTNAAACAAYKRITSVKVIQAFVSRYGKKATKAVVLKKKAPAKKKSVKRKSAKRSVKRKPAKRVVKRKTAKRRPAKRTTKRKTTRRNKPITKRDAAAVRRILKKHGY